MVTAQRAGTGESLLLPFYFFSSGNLESKNRILEIVFSPGEGKKRFCR